MKNLNLISMLAESEPNTFYCYRVCDDGLAPYIQEVAIPTDGNSENFLYVALMSAFAEGAQFTSKHEGINQVAGAGYAWFCSPEGSRIPVKDWPALCDRAKF